MFTKPNAPSYTIGQAPKLKLELKSTPGPGSYKIHKSLTSRGTTFPRSSRILTKLDPVPGPGKYTLPSTLGKAPHPLMLSRHSSLSHEASPGPGDYSPKLLSKSTQYSFPKQKETFPLKIAPGPGSYNPDLLTPSKRSAFIGSSLRMPKPIKDSPGPGAYNLKRSLGEKFVSFPRAARSSVRINIAPGPADYSPKFVYQTPNSSISQKVTLEFRMREKILGMDGKSQRGKREEGGKGMKGMNSLTTRKGISIRGKMRLRGEVLGAKESKDKARNLKVQSDSLLKVRKSYFASGGKEKIIANYIQR